MKNEITKTETQLPAVSTMAEMGMSAEDIVIPRLMLMQNTSEYVGDGKAKLGDVVNSQTLEVLGGMDKPVEFIPLKMQKMWRINDMTTQQAVFLRNEPFTPANANLPWEDNEAGMPIRRDLCMNFFVLLASECGNGEAFPCLVSFKRTGIQAGKQLATHIFKLNIFKKAPYSSTMMLSVSKQKHETNTYAQFQVSKGKPCSPEQVAQAETWLKLLGSMTYRIDEEKDESTHPASTGKVVVGDTKDGDLPY